MKHIFEFEAFSLHEENTVKTAFKNLEEFIQKNPTGKKLAEDCQKLVKAMRGAGTDEDAIMDVFKSIKSKDELVKLLALWDSMDINYEKSAQDFFTGLYKTFSGQSGSYEKTVKNRWNLVSSGMRDVFSNLDFWNAPSGSPEVQKYLAIRKAWYDKNPNMKETSLSYWLKEELDESELKELNDILKKFGFSF